MIEFRVRDRDAPDHRLWKPHWRVVKRKGRVFMVDGRELEVFPVGVLCEALDRKLSTFEMWEKKKLFPPPMYQVPHFKRKMRFYSGEQIINLHRLMHGKYGGAKSVAFKKDMFLEEARTLFYERDIVLDENGQRIQQKKVTK